VSETLERLVAVCPKRFYYILSLQMPQDIIYTVSTPMGHTLYSKVYLYFIRTVCRLLVL